MRKLIKSYFQKLVNSSTIPSKFDENLRVNHEILWGHIFNNTIIESAWLKNKSFSPGRWAVGYPGLYIIYRVLNDFKPKSILEFGLGESSKMTYQYIIYHPDYQLKIIEQDKNWLAFFSNEKYNVRANTILLPIEEISLLGDKTNVYKDLIPSINNNKYDFIIVDGPWGSKNNSRSQIVNIIENELLEKEFVILIDDFERVGEKQTADRILSLLSKKGIKYNIGIYSGLKDTAIICSESASFLTSL